MEHKDWGINTYFNYPDEMSNTDRGDFDEYVHWSDYAALRAQVEELESRATRAEAEAKRYREALETIAAGTSSIEDDGASCDAPCPNSREIARKALEEVPNDRR